MTTKSQVDEIYSRPVDPKNPFDRLTTLLNWAISEMEKVKTEIEPPPLLPLFCCRFCEKTFTDEYELGAHVNRHHNMFSNQQQE
jgi:hypothetical protein